MAMGGIKYDPYTNEQAQRWVQAKSYNTLEDQCGDTWPEREGIWCNPPYSRGNMTTAVDRWVANTDEGFILVNADTRTAWFKKLCEYSDIRLFCGAISFVDPETLKGRRGNRIGQALFFRSKYLSGLVGYKQAQVITSSFIYRHGFYL